jgi:hypothetical protein
VTPKLEDIIQQLNVSKQSARYNGECEKVVIQGKHGYVCEDERDPCKIHVFVTARSERHFRSIKRRLAFMRAVMHDDDHLHFTLVIGDELPAEHAETIRKVVGLNGRGLDAVREYAVSCFSRCV